SQYNCYVFSHSLLSIIAVRQSLMPLGDRLIFLYIESIREQRSLNLGISCNSLQNHLPTKREAPFRRISTIY
ncbi:MAG: hypothetical protein ACRCZZ_02320, partial [Phocaeicola sp.]